MEESGSDIATLGAIFDALKNLKVVRVDMYTYLIAYSHFDVVRCGKADPAMDGAEWNRDNEVPYFNRALGVVLKLFGGTIGKVKSNWIFFNLYPNDPPPTRFFNLASTQWKDSMCSRVQRVQIGEGNTSQWARSLLGTAKNLWELGIIGNWRRTDLSRITGNSFKWPKLRCIWLDNMEMESEGFVGFLDAHRPTLTELNLQSIALVSGTRVEPLRVSESMALLNHFSIGLVYEETTPPDGLQSTSTVPTKPGGSIFFSSLSTSRALTLRGHWRHDLRSQDDPLRRMVNHLRTLHWPNLQAFALAHIQIGLDNPNAIFLPHKETVRCVVISGYSVANGDWKAIISSLQTLPRLQAVNLADLETPTSVECPDNEDFDRLNRLARGLRNGNCVRLKNTDIRTGLELPIRYHCSVLDTTRFEDTRHYVGICKLDAFV
ncbi:hypothetical protein K458DRAFT_436999 [Lentithecium fluviatile CBS 122367]|uniref:Uncharacterized protein n=1 Tax=Lentithecium fluviatile CBS 122367 TaxID=1168545 RepID=A0A6G1IG01_9PLEO|nr:hypothetical protein K458DRAFT_436999 [Lentithecium fluviatile CBS 122367]